MQIFKFGAGLQHLNDLLVVQLNTFNVKALQICLLSDQLCKFVGVLLGFKPYSVVTQLDISKTSDL